MKKSLFLLLILTLAAALAAFSGSFSNSDTPFTQGLMEFSGEPECAKTAIKQVNPAEELQPRDLRLNPPSNLTAVVVNSNDVQLNWNAPATEVAGFSDGFESYPDWALNFAPWTLIDVDQSGTFGIQGHTWPNVFAPQSFIVFNPGATTPPFSGSMTAHSGNKMLASFSSTTPPNDDWLISPTMVVQPGDFLKFYARSLNDTYLLNQFSVAISNGSIIPSQFNVISGTLPIDAPLDWTLFSYDLSSYVGLTIRFAIHNNSNRGFFLSLDDFRIGPEEFFDSFEAYTDFSLNFPPWTCVDVDQSGTYGHVSYEFPNQFSPMAYIIFNPNNTVPPTDTVVAHSGDKMAASFATTSPPSNDWLISEPIVIGSDYFLDFYAETYKSLVHSLARFKVGISLGGTNPADFTIISGPDFLEALQHWTQYTFDLSSYTGLTIRFGIQCVSTNSFIFLVDDVHVGPYSVPNPQPVNSQLAAELLRSTGISRSATTLPDPPTRELLGYKIYRNGALVGTVTNFSTVSYNDMNLLPGLYSYTVTAYYTSGESNPAGPASTTVYPPVNPPNNLTVAVNGDDVILDWDAPDLPPQPPFTDGFESYPNFSLSFAPWTLVDVDMSPTYNIAGTTWPNAFAAQSYIIFNQSATTPPITSVPAHGGAKVAACFAATTPPNNDWMMSQLFMPNPGNHLNFWARSYSAQYGLERFKVGISTGGVLPSNYTIISGANYLQAPVDWTLYSYDLSAYAGQQIRFGIQCVSDDAFVFLLDDVTTGGRNALSALNQLAPQESMDPPLRNLLGYKIYRDGNLIQAITNTATTTFTDANRPAGTYTYGVSANYDNGESAPETVTVTVDIQLGPVVFEDSFESYANFTTLFAPWTMIDVDNVETYGYPNNSFPGSGNPMAYVIMNPSATNPPLTSVSAFSGSKMAASFVSSVPPNNDWMISPSVHLGTGSAMRFYARSHSADNSLERFRVGVSTSNGISTDSFQYISGGSYVTAPANWTAFAYDLSAYNNQSVRIGIRCVSNDASTFYVDDFSIHSTGGYVGNPESSTPPLATELHGNFPNPFNPETTIRFTLENASNVALEIYNLKGQLVKTLLNGPSQSGSHSVVWNGRDSAGHAVSSGMYYCRVTTGNYTGTKKMIMIK
jgi:hypothetical protein